MEAKGIACRWVDAKRTRNDQLEEICAEISKKHADYLY